MIICLIVSFISATIYRNKEKVDKGFVFAYYKLSYRRKLIRTLWSVPLIILCLIIIYKLADWSQIEFILFSGILIIGIVMQFCYVFAKWKKYERHSLKVEL